MGKMKYNYHSVNLPENLARKIQEVVDSGEYGYSDIPEFTVEAVRRFLRELGYLK